MEKYSTSEKLSIEEFEESFWEYMPQSIVSDEDIFNNKDWADMIVHEAWRLYSYSDVDKSFIFKNIENVLFAFARYKPSFKS